MKTTHAELVFQTLRYVCETLADGDIQAVLDLGLRMDQIARLARFSMNDLRHLSDVPTHFMDVTVNAECLDRVIAHLEAGDINADDWITHPVAMEDMIGAFDSYLDPASGMIKAMVEI